MGSNTEAPATVSSQKGASEAPQDEDVNPLVQQQAASDIWMMLLAFRFINVLGVRTFFQPDEYFQSLEPAWQMSFGTQSGAWITWVRTHFLRRKYFLTISQEWQYQLRSSLHPALFAAVYYLAEKLMVVISGFPQFRAAIHAVLPNVVQGLFAAAGDYYTWQLAERMYGIGNRSTKSVVC